MAKAYAVVPKESKLLVLEFDGDDSSISDAEKQSMIDVAKMLADKIIENPAYPVTAIVSPRYRVYFAETIENADL